MKQLALAAALAVLLSRAAFAQTGGHCTRETLPVKGTAVTIGYCVVGTHGEGGERTVQVAETYSSPRGSFSQTSPLEFIAGDQPSRVIEDVALSQLGIAGTLHLTLVLRGGAVHVEAAMLTPGAITIK